MPSDMDTHLENVRCTLMEDFESSDEYAGRQESIDRKYQALKGKLDSEDDRNILRELADEFNDDARIAQREAFRKGAEYVLMMFENARVRGIRIEP